jgi:hypothetical protein
MTTLDNRHSAAVANFYFNRNLQVYCLAKHFLTEYAVDSDSLRSTFDEM